MKFSMNGFRRSLNADIQELRDIVESVVSEERDYDPEDLVTAMNNVITHSNVINCVYDKENPDFSEMGDLEIEHIEPQSQN